MTGTIYNIHRAQRSVYDSAVYKQQEAPCPRRISSLYCGDLRLSDTAISHPTMLLTAVADGWVGLQQHHINLGGNIENISTVIYT